MSSSATPDAVEDDRGPGDVDERWTTSLAPRLARCAIETELSSIPDAVITKVKAHLLDQLGAQVLGASLVGTLPVRQYALRHGARGDCTVVGSSKRLDAEYAGLVNGTTGHGCEIDDYAPRASTHPGCEVVPAAVAMAEEVDASGAELLRSVALGFETAVRIGLATMPSMLLDRGFHENCVHGVVSSAIAAGGLKRLPEREQATALSIAVSHASGTTEYSQSGGEVKRLHAGLGAMGGIRAVRLAELGLSGPPTIFEGKRGYFQAYSQEYKPERLLAGWGDVWEFDASAAIKPHFCVGSIHAHIEALRALRAEHGFSPDEVTDIVLGVDPLTKKHAGATGPEPASLVAAQFSAEFSLAMHLVRGSNSLTDYQELEAASFRDPEILRISRLTHLELDDECTAAWPEKRLGRVTVTLTSGRQITNAAYGLGTPDNPMSAEDVTAKYHGLVEPIIGRARADRLAEAVMGLEEVPSVRTLGALLAGE